MKRRITFNRLDDTTWYVHTAYRHGDIADITMHDDWMWVFENCEVPDYLSALKEHHIQAYMRRTHNLNHIFVTFESVEDECEFMMRCSDGLVIDI
jgi:hypothetical protein